MIPRRKKKPAKFVGLPFAPQRKKRGQDRKRLEKECDELWSTLIRLRDGRCQFCMKVTEFKKLFAHHIWTRTSRAGRWNESNGVTLCWRCHHHVAHQMYEVFRRWLILWMGQEKFDRLMLMCNTRTKHSVADLQMIKADLKSKVERMGNAK